MERMQNISASEWRVMEQLWLRPHSLMELVAALQESVGWSKSTVATMVRRMEEKGLIAYDERGRTKIFRPTVSREEVTARETGNLLQRAYHGSIGMMVSAMAQRNGLSKEDIEELYAVLKQAEEDAK